MFTFIVFRLGSDMLFSCFFAVFLQSLSQGISHGLWLLSWRRVDDCLFFDCSSSFYFLLIEFHCFFYLFHNANMLCLLLLYFITLGFIMLQSRFFQDFYCSLPCSSPISSRISTVLSHALLLFLPGFLLFFPMLFYFFQDFYCSLPRDQSSDVTPHLGVYYIIFQFTSFRVHASSFRLLVLRVYDYVVIGELRLWLCTEVIVESYKYRPCW